jgi:acetyltransferase-like isoleucine patch superfamily enzyme
MVDYALAEVRRLQDRASPSHLTLGDRLRRWRHGLRPNAEFGAGVVFKAGVEISICDEGKLTVGDHSFFHARAWILMTRPKPTVTIGRWVFVGRDTVIAAKNLVEIGDFSIFAPRCYVIDHEHGFAAGELIHNQRSALKEVHIGRDCYFGTGAVVLGGVTVGDGAIVGAGSVVTKDVPAQQVWGGNPARYIKDRD